jgi:aldose 1-epimerase
VASLWSDWSGIRLDVYTDQEAFQMYSCGGQNGTFPLKTTQGHPTGSSSSKTKFPRTVPQYGCVVLEVEDWIDGINYPEWGRLGRQVIEPGGDPYVLQFRYKFTVG